MAKKGVLELPHDFVFNSSSPSPLFAFAPPLTPLHQEERPLIYLSSLSSQITNNRRSPYLNGINRLLPNHATATRTQTPVNAEIRPCRYVYTYHMA